MFELKTLREYLNENLINDFVVFFNFSIESFILFVKKKNDLFRLCVDYKKFNAMTIKNKYSLFLISQLLILIQEATCQSNFDIILLGLELSASKAQDF